MKFKRINNKEYKDNYDELNQARINKILRERNE